MKTDKALGLQTLGLIFENKVSVNSNLTKISTKQVTQFTVVI